MAMSVAFTDQRESPSHPVSDVPSKIFVNPGGIGKTPAAGLAGPPLLAASTSRPASVAPLPPVLEPLSATGLEPPEPPAPPFAPPEPDPPGDPALPPEPPPAAASPGSEGPDVEEHPAKAATN